MMDLEKGQDGNLGRMNAGHVRAFARGSSKETGEQSGQRLRLALVTIR